MARRSFIGTSAATVGSAAGAALLLGACSSSSSPACTAHSSGNFTVTLHAKSSPITPTMSPDPSCAPDLPLAISFAPGGASGVYEYTVASPAAGTNKCEGPAQDPECSTDGHGVSLNCCSLLMPSATMCSGNDPITTMTIDPGANGSIAVTASTAVCYYAN